LTTHLTEANASLSDFQVKTCTLLEQMNLSDSKAISTGCQGDNDVTSTADAVVITMPIPQVLNLKGLCKFAAFTFFEGSSL